MEARTIKPNLRTENNRSKARSERLLLAHM